MKSNYRQKIFFAIILLLIVGSPLLAIRSKVVRHSSLADFTAADAETENVIITSDGQITLGQQVETLISDINDTWLINAIAINDAGQIYIGTSPNGAIFKYDGQLTKIYPLEETNSDNPIEAKTDTTEDVNDSNDPNDPNAPTDANETVGADITNEHIFALAFDQNNRLLAGVSGKEAKLLRFVNDKPTVIFEPNETKYIFAIELDQAGNIYLGTGPQGKIYKLDNVKEPFLGIGAKKFKFELGENAELVYDAEDKNILALALGGENTLYAGSDERGLVYKINLQTKTASVVYDADETEITALVFDNDGNLYATATSKEVAKNQQKPNGMSTPPKAMPGRPPSRRSSNDGNTDGGLKLKIANTSTDTDKQAKARKLQAQSDRQKGPASHLYKIDKDGFVTDVFSKTSLFFTAAQKNGQIIIGSGNQAKLFAYDTQTEEDSLLYQDKQACQILAIEITGDNIYIATGNPAKLITVKSSYAKQGYYLSPLIDAAQPAKWGRFQLDADIPDECKITFQARTGNVAEANDPTFSDWTAPVMITEPILLDVPQSRFCQYRLNFETENNSATPLVSETAIAYIIPNLAPKVISVQAEKDKAKSGIFNISYKADDKNEDTLVYKLEFKEAERKIWIEIEDDFDKTEYKWDSRTVEDGRYEIRITASDEKSNDAATKLLGSRISDIVVIDNTPPDIDIKSVETTSEDAKIKFAVADTLSIIGSVHYTVNSSTDYSQVLPVDYIYDSTEEEFDIIIGDLDPGTYVIAFKIADDIGNTRYKTIELTIE